MSLVPQPVLEYSWETMRDDLEAAKICLQRRGVQVHPSSRLARYHKWLSMYCAQVKGDMVTIRKQDGAALYQALFESVQFKAIVTQLVDDDAWLKHMRLLVQGNALPSDDGTKTIARNTQFELYLAAVLRMSGAKVTPQEPDLLVDLGKLSLSIACKRLSSEKRLHDRIREACEQIEKCGRAGVVALELSRILYAPRTTIRAANNAEAKNIMQMQIRGFADRHGHTIQRALEGKRVLGVFIAQAHTYWNVQMAMPGISAECFPLVHPRQPREQLKWIHKLGVHLNGPYGRSEMGR